MIDKKTIVSFILRFTKKGKKTFAKQTVHPKREWFIGVCLFLCVVSMGGVFSYFTSIRYKTLDAVTVGEFTDVATYKKNTVEKALTLYAQKKNIFETMQQKGLGTESSQITAVSKTPKLATTTTATSKPMSHSATSSNIQVPQNNTNKPATSSTQQAPASKGSLQLSN